MLRLRSCIAARLLSSTSTAPISPLHRLLSAAAAPAVSPNPSFNVEEYLVATCGLNGVRALEASTKLSSLRSPSKPDAVLAVLAGLGLCDVNVAAVVAKDPLLLRASVKTTLNRNIAELTDLGLSRTEVARLVLLQPSSLRRRYVASKVQYYLPIFGSIDSFLQALGRGPSLLSCNLDNTVKPNVAFLQECGLHACDISKLCLYHPRLLTTSPEGIQALAARADAIGVPCGSGMFKHALHAALFATEAEIALKVEYMKHTFRWSDAEVGIAVSKFPKLLSLSMAMLRRNSEFLMCEVGLEPAYIADRSAMVSLRLECCLRLGTRL